MSSVQEKVADAILQKPSSIILGGREFFVPSPTYGTLIAVSAIIGKAPYSKEIDDNTTVADTIARVSAESYAPEVLATLIMGAKKLNETDGLFKNFKKALKIDTNAEYKRLVGFITNEVTVSEIDMALTSIFTSQMDLAFFLKTTHFLKGMSMTNPTKETNQTAPTP